MKYFTLGLSFLTAIPVRLKEAPQSGDLGRAGIWFPLIGILIGGISTLALYELRMVLSPLLAAALAGLVWIALSGGLHLDGLADCCDGMLNASKPERRLEIMKDPRLGTFGGMGLILAILIKVAAIYSLSTGAVFAALPLAACLARWMLLPAGKQPLARPGGLGADFAAGISPRVLLAAAIPTLVLSALCGWRGLLAALLAHMAAWGILGVAKNRLGGVTGDVLGLTVEVSELVVLLCFCLN